MMKQTGLEVKKADRGKERLSFVCLLQERIEQNAATYTKANITTIFKSHSVRSARGKNL